MTELQESNSTAYHTWLGSIGIVPSSRLSDTILSGQVLATLVSLATEQPAGDTFGERINNLDWWFYPLC